MGDRNNLNGVNSVGSKKKECRIEEGVDVKGVEGEVKKMGIWVCMSWKGG